MKIAFVYVNNEENIGRGAGYIVGALKRAGADVDFFNTLHTRSDKVAQIVIEGSYDFLMISTMTMLFPIVLRFISLIKKSKNIPVLIGGIHPTIFGAELMEKNLDIDYLCVGEGESMVIQFIEKFGTEEFYSIKNLVYRKDGKVITNPIRLPEDLSQLADFPWELFPKKAVILPDTGFCYVHATRGCPYNCSYCCNGIYLKKYGKNYLRFIPVEKVINELLFLKKKYSPSLFYFGDEMLFFNNDYVKELGTAIYKTVKIPYGCMIRVEYMSEATAEFLKNTGCRYIGMGIECGDENFRKKYLNRKMKDFQIKEAFRIVKKIGIFVTSFNMIGYPFEYDAALTGKTIELNKIIRPDFSQFSIFYPFPGTKLYKHCIDNELIDFDKYNKTYHYFEDSVIKGYQLKDKLIELNSELNPAGFNFVNNF